MCHAAESAGAGALWACDHLFWHSPVFECLTAMTVAAAATSTATIGSCVLQLPLRRPVVVAKQVAALQHVAAARVVLGVGVGSHRGEYDAAGVPFERRGQLLDEGIDTLRRLWAQGQSAPSCRSPEPAGLRAAARAEAGAPSDGDVGPDGEAERYEQRPLPGAVPVWVGGSSEAALERAARRGDGWIPLFVEPGAYRIAMERLDAAATSAGRAPASISRAITVFVSVGGDDAHQRGCEWLSSLYRLPPHAFSRHLVSGDAGRCAEQLSRWTEAGASHVAVYVASDDPLVAFEKLSQQFADVATKRDVRGMVAQ